MIKQFEQQLLRDAELEEKRFTEEQQDLYEKQVNQIEAEKSAQLDDINKLQHQLLEQMEFFKVVLKELDTKKQEINSTYQASVQYLRRELSNKQTQQKERLIKHIQEKKEIFKNYVVENNIWLPPQV